MADGWNYWGLERKKLVRCSRYLSDKCAKFGRHPQHITKSWAGTLSHVIGTGTNKKNVEERIREQIRSQTDNDTRYFIASLGSKADSPSYEAFAEAIRGLD
jgi:hypothetical protein